jgi:hypothetical protein
MPGPGPYYTALVSMQDIKGFPFDYALYFSTDHDRGIGGIWLYLCNGNPSQAASWVSYDEAINKGVFDYLSEKPTGNPIFIDTVQGNGHTETPYVNIIANTVYMSYHKDRIGPSQATLLSTSTDGINFKRINGENDSVILSYNVEESIGNGHTGYFRWGPNPFSGITKKYIGYSLHGGGPSHNSAFWSSDNAVDWEKECIFIPAEGLAVDKEDSLVTWHEIDPASIKRLDTGEYVVLCAVCTNAFGTMPRISELYEIFLAEDGKTLTRECRKVLANGSGDELDTEEIASVCITEFDNQLHLLYVGVCGNSEINTVMGAVGTFDKDAELPAKLSDGSQNKFLHIEKTPMEKV